MSRIVLTGLLWIPTTLFAQQPLPESGARAFEVASIRPYTGSERAITINTEPGGRFVATNVSVRTLIRIAYQLENFQVIDAPSWVNDDSFDVLAKGDRELPPMGGPFSGPPDLREMLRALLRVRFGLVARVETRQLPAFALTFARDDRKLGNDLKPSAVDCADLFAKRGPDDDPPRCGLQLAPGTIVSEGGSISQLAEALSAMVGRKVEDRTGLPGTYDAELHWEGPRPGAVPPKGPSLFTAVQEQLGLKLESTIAPLDVLVIESISRPTPN